MPNFAKYYPCNNNHSSIQYQLKMAIAEKVKQVLKGGEFLIKNSSPQDVFTPEDFTEEQKMFADMANEFIDKRIMPNVERVDKQEPGLTEQLLQEAADLGLLGAAIPEAYGGMGVDINTESIITEILGGAHSFSVAYSAHTGIGTLPILYFGTEAQKQKYLPGLGSGAIKAAYCLTEPGSGSDALAALTKATLTEDGEHYMIEGQKMWITNSGFADLFTVFAKIDGTLFTAFLIDATAENVRLGAEEDKMGIKGSSTRQVFFEGVKVPKENILGEIGQGHKIAFNVLNIGRYKLSVMTAGSAKRACHKSVAYANERQQFGQSISGFGAIKEKLAEQAIRIYAVESANYRTSQLLEQKKEALVAKGEDPSIAKLLAAEEYAIECAMLKVLGSEVLDYVVDETVQIYGGNGYSEEYPAARAYRDARINRIFEGTNEINRLLTVNMTLKRAMKGQLDIMAPAMAVQKELMGIPDFGGDDNNDILAADIKAVAQAKKAILMVAGAAAQKLMKQLKSEQEIVMSIANMMIEVFAAESALLRTQKMIAVKGEAACSEHIDMTQVFISDAMERILSNGKRAVCAFAKGNELKMMLLGMKRFTKYPPYNSIAARRRVAAKMIAANKNPF